MSTEIIYETKTPYNGNVQVVKEKGYLSILNQYKSRYPSYQTSVKEDTPYISKFQFYPAGMTLGLGYLDPTTNPNVILIGVAGGFLVNYLTEFAPNINLTAVEIDPEMINIAQTYFNVTHPIINQDGFDFMQHHKEPTDILLLDAFQSMNIPEVFNDQKFFDTLQNTKILVCNIVKSSNSEAFLSLIKKNFKFVDHYYYKGNLTTVAYNEPIPDLPNRMELNQAKYNFIYKLPLLFRYKDNHIRSYDKSKSLFTKERD